MALACMIFFLSLPSGFLWIYLESSTISHHASFSLQRDNVHVPTGVERHRDTVSPCRPPGVSGGASRALGPGCSLLPLQGRLPACSRKAQRAAGRVPRAASVTIGSENEPCSCFWPPGDADADWQCSGIWTWLLTPSGSPLDSGCEGAVPLAEGRCVLGRAARGL